MDELHQLPIPLLVWYREKARVLPWRSDPTPYHVPGSADEALAGAGLLQPGQKSAKSGRTDHE